MSSIEAGPAGTGTGAEADGGFALLEVLVSVTILGIAVVAILGGMATSINVSDLHRQQAEVDAVLISAVERLKAPEITVPCALTSEPTYLTAARKAIPERPEGEEWDESTVTISGIRYWNGTEYLADVANCHPQLTLQEITLTIAHPNGRVTNSMAFVKDAVAVEVVE